MSPSAGMATRGAALLGVVLLALLVVRAAPDGATARADAALERQDWRGAREASRAALARAPLDVTALYDLTVASLGLERLPDAVEGARLSSALGWREPSVQLLLMSDALARGDLTSAAQRADALGRDGDQPAETFAAVRTILRRPGGVEAVAARLALSPQWRDAFFADTGPLSSVDYAPREALYARLERTMAPVTADEVAPYAEQLVQRGDYGRARAAWIAHAGDGADAAAALQDGGFRALSGPATPFAWRAGTIVGAQVGQAEAVDRGRAVLSVTSDGSATGRILAQTVVLPPGPHAFSIDAATGEGLAPVGDMFRWSIACVGAAGPLEMMMWPGTRMGKWQRLEGVFEVPAADCPAQTVALSLRTGDGGGGREMQYDRAALR